jgi:lysophospholipase L1-like esterase
MADAFRIPELTGAFFSLTRLAGKTFTGPLAIAVLLPCACAKSAPSSSELSRSPGATASDWTGALHLPPASSGDEAGSDAAMGAWVLHLGDSFVTASFAQHLGPRFRSAGARQVVLAKASTDTMSWAKDPDVEPWLSRRPSLVIVTLGANEVDNLVPKLHAGAIRTISHKVGAVAPCVWVAPPLWKADVPGWLQVLHDHCDPCLFFDSDAVLGGLGQGERRRDGIHPNERGGRRWADAFWDWLADHRDRSRGSTGPSEATRPTGPTAPWTLLAFETR